MSWKSQPASAPQRGFIATLLQDRDVPETAHALFTAENAAPLTKGRAGEIIDALKLCPFKQKQASAKPAPSLPQVAAGRYALEDDGQVAFFQVDRPTKGRWAGATFLTRLSGENHEPIRRRQQPALFNDVIAAIAADPEAAARRYGHYRNECGYCRHGLTDQFSRFFGVGPVCARKHGMPFSFASYIRAYPHEDAAVAAWLAEDAKTHEVSSEDANREWAEWKNEAARLEAEQETAAFMAGI